MVVKEEGREIFRGQINLRPAQNMVIGLKDVSSPDNLVISLGRKIIHPTAKDSELSRPLKFHHPSGDSPQALFLAAQNQENERNYTAALEKYLEVIKKEPEHLPALNRLAGSIFAGGNTRQPKTMPGADWKFPCMTLKPITFMD